MHQSLILFIPRCAVLMAALLAWAGAAWGDPIALPISLEKLAAKTDIIFKGTAVSSGPVQDAWFESRSGVVAQETQFTVISVIKGHPPGETLRFHHYDSNEESSQPQFNSYPQCYHFQDNRSYIVFAKRIADAGIYRQLWTYPVGKGDQGVLLCTDNKPVVAKTIKKAFWNELTRMLKDADVNDATYAIRQLDNKKTFWNELMRKLKETHDNNVMYAIRQLDDMSGSLDEIFGTKDFDRTNVVKTVHSLMTNSDPKIAQTAIAIVASHNPYFSDDSKESSLYPFLTVDRTEYWLATVGSAEVPGIGKMDPKMRNVGGELYWKDLESIASSQHPAAMRALAIRALGLVREPALREAINNWLADSETSVRAAATVLLADFPGTETNKQLTVLADDPEPVVRSCVARAIGFSQQKQLIVVLGKLLADKDAEVRRFASLSLLSFSPKNEAVSHVFRANLGNKEFDPLFLNALAREYPDQYLDDLARVVEEKPLPSNCRGGEVPEFTAWNILFKYLQTQSPETLKSGKMDHYLYAMEKIDIHSNQSPNIYAFYLSKGMPDQAKKFRAWATKASSYDLEPFFRDVDRRLWRVQTDIPFNARPAGLKISGYLSRIANHHQVIEMEMSLLQRDEQLEREQPNIIKHAKRPEGYIPTKERRLDILDTISGAQSDLKKVHELLESAEAKQIPEKTIMEFIHRASEEESYLGAVHEFILVL